MEDLKPCIIDIDGLKDTIMKTMSRQVTNGHALEYLDSMLEAVRLSYNILKDSWNTRVSGTLPDQCPELPTITETVKESLNELSEVQDVSETQKEFDKLQQCPEQKPFGNTDIDELKGTLPEREVDNG